MKKLILILLISLSFFAFSQNRNEIGLVYMFEKIHVTEDDEDNNHITYFNEEYVGVQYSYDSKVVSFFVGYNYKYKTTLNILSYSSEKYQIPFGVRFNLFKKWFRPFVGVTLYNNFIYNERYSKSLAWTFSYRPPDYHPSFNRYYENLFNYQLGVNPVIGFNLKIYKRVNFRFEFNFQVNKSVLKNVGNYKQNNIVFSLAYCFEKLKR